MRNGLVSALCLSVLGLGAAALLSLPAAADIKTFNAAVSRSDYKAAAAEAASTWPTLDKSRKDINVIAQEFGYAAFMSNDYAASRTYAEFASSHSDIGADTGADPYLQAVSTVLLKLSEHRLQPSDKTRDDLLAAVMKRADQPGFDNVSYLGVDSILAYDMDKAAWAAAKKDADLGVQLASVGGAYYAIPKRRLELFSGIAEYFTDPNVNAFVKVRKLKKTIADDIDTAASDDAARLLLPIYWETTTWRQAMGSHLFALRKKVPEDPDGPAYGSTPVVGERFQRIFPSGGDCKIEPVWSKEPEYPPSSKYKNFVAAVLVATDIDEKGNPVNTRILGAAPEVFGPHVLKIVTSARFKRAWGEKADCKLARKNHRMDFEFQVRGF
ncbi:MAG TPA: hypothetical protein VGO52_01475 [Hyphomonadaceae bacterium]|jgi:hypothetical protein|nr:hypothetical protein [Hyphomonadaceae bacterium]